MRLIYSIVMLLLLGCDSNGVNNQEIFKGEKISGTERNITNEIVPEIGGVPKISPDKTQIVYIKKSQGVNRIYIYDIAKKNERMLVEGIDPDWSPDGSWIVYSSSSGQISKIDIDGLEETQLTNSGFNFRPDWHPTENRIVYWAQGDNNGAEGGIIVIDSDGGYIDRITSGLNPDWSPSEDILGVLKHEDPNSSNYRTDTYSAPEKQVRDRLFIGTLNSRSRPRISPDGQRMLAHNDDGIWVANIDGSNQKLILPSQRIVGGTGLFSFPAWHPDGVEMIFEHFEISEINVELTGTQYSGIYALYQISVDLAVAAAS